MQIAPDSYERESGLHAVRSKRREVGVLLVAEEALGRSLVEGLHAEELDAELATSLVELRARAAVGGLEPHVVFVDLDLRDASLDEWIATVQRGFPGATAVALGRDLCGERAARLLGAGVPSLNKPVAAQALAHVALRLARSAGERVDRSPPSSGGTRVRGDLDAVFEAFATARRLSKQQRVILSLYLGGKNDKEIAVTCGCSEATVYEHWRRMARKVGGTQKTDVIADFHRFLGG